MQSFDKDKLIDIYNRIVLPFSQRKYNNKRLLEKRLNHLRLSRKVKTINYDKIENLSKNDVKNLETNNEEKESINNNLESSQVNPAINNSDNLQSLNKKIRLSDSTPKSVDVEEQSNEQKRKSNMPLKTDTKKRQKITWP
ncbi:uncharacterized membrane protein DDB_G0293934-like isoform X2 [Chelonus insularis]|nr:uncharacterized membrane protein DDB_G0293934-like isoform X2 [Chelonus insularis]